jgi:hypothetical protein
MILLGNLRLKLTQPNSPALTTYHGKPRKPALTFHKRIPIPTHPVFGVGYTTLPHQMDWKQVIHPSKSHHDIHTYAISRSVAPSASPQASAQTPKKASPRKAIRHGSQKFQAL